MAAVFERPSLRQRIAPSLQGFDGPLAFAVFLLACAGLLTMYSSGHDYGARFYDHARNMVLAGTIMFVVAQVPPQRLMSFAVPLYVLGVGLLVAVAVFGITKKGAKRWINVGVVIQPSEILKIAMPLMLAWWFQKREGQLRPLDFIVAGLLLAAPVGLIMKQPDLGTALLVTAAGTFALFLSGMAWWRIGVLLAAVGGMIPVAWHFLHQYQRDRVLTLLNPESDPLGNGWHIIQSQIAVGSGGIFGKGWQHSTQSRLDFLPEHTTDFIFAVFSEEFGLVGVIALITLYAFIIGRCLWIAMEARETYSRLLAGAIGMSFFVYVFVNGGMIAGMLPVVGVPLPLISYGGTSAVSLLVAFGVLMSIHANRKRHA